MYIQVYIGIYTGVPHEVVCTELPAAFTVSDGTR
jgi:hypothetical protein